MEKINPLDYKVAIAEGEFLEQFSIETLMLMTDGMQNILNLQTFAADINPINTLSLGGGLGTELFFIKAKNAVLLDLNTNLLDKAADYAQIHKVSLIAKNYDITKLPLPFKDKQFDLVIMNAVVEHIPNIFDLLEEVKRVGRNFFIGSIPIGNPPKDHLHVWKWKDRNDVLKFSEIIKGALIGSYWAHYDIIWKDEWKD